MNRQETNRVARLLVRDRLRLLDADRLLGGDEAHESLEVRAAQLLVRAGEPAELAQIRVSAPSVPARQHREVVVVLRDDPVAEALEPGAGRDAKKPFVALPEGFDQAAVA